MSGLRGHRPRLAVDVDGLVDRSLSLNEGAITVPNFTIGSWYWKAYAQSDRLDPDKPLRDYSDEEWQWFMHQPATKSTLGGMNTNYEGLLVKVRRVFIDKQAELRQAHARAFVERIATFTDCEECGGSRLNEAARTASVHGRTIPECSAMQVSDLLPWVEGVEDPEVAPLVANLAAMLRSFVEIGLGYLSLDRESGTLSGGEAQRVKMIRHLGSALTDITYVFDEPTVGLHPHDVARMNGLLRQLRDKGNTVLVVEHKPEVMAIADHVVDLGPGAGHDGGTVTYEGPYAGLRGSGTVTGRYLDQRIGLRPSARSRTGVLEVRGASTHNLRDVDVDVPTGVLTVVTGVAGSGKSSLVHGSLAGRDGVLVVDQSAIRGSRRSNPATYTGLLDPIRTAFAKANGVSASLFSANSEGACPTCNGQGVIYTDLAMMAGVATRCEACGGRRFRPEVLEHRLHGLTIDEVLRLSMAEAAEVFTTGSAPPDPDPPPRRRAAVPHPRPAAHDPVRRRAPAAQARGLPRRRLDVRARRADVGLHLADTENLVGMLHGSSTQGDTVVVIEHNLAVIAQADWIIDIGPGAGHDGGTVVFEGTPHDMVAESDTLTAQHLRRWVSPRPTEPPRAARVRLRATRAPPAMPSRCRSVSSRIASRRSRIAASSATVCPLNSP